MVRRSSISSGSSIYIFGQGDLKRDQGDSNRAPQEQLRSCEEFHAIAPPPPIPNTIKFNIDSSLPRREQPALPTGTQGEEGYTHGIGVPPPLVGRPGASGELGSHQQFCESHSTTQVCGRRSGVDHVALEDWNEVDMTCNIDEQFHMIRGTVKRTSRDKAYRDPILIISTAI